jgi:hypothetical protein
MVSKTSRGWLQITDLSTGTREFDREFWAAQPAASRFLAGWELAKLAHLAKGGTEDELRLRRTPLTVQTIPG